MRVHLHTPGGAGALRERHQRVESVYVNLFRIFPIISLPQIPLADINRATSSSPIWSSNSLCRDDIAICKEPVDSGSCTSGATKRFYFDEEYQTCRAFIYTGCGGNRNRFKTFESCINTCLRSKSRPPLTSLTFFWSFIFFLADVSPFQLCSDVQHTHISPFYVYTCAATILAFLYILCIFLRFVTVHSPSSIYQFALASVFSPATNCACYNCYIYIDPLDLHCRDFFLSLLQFDSKMSICVMERFWHLLRNMRFIARTFQ